MVNDEFEYDVAVSFAGEDRATAERFAELLKAQGMRVFYDNWEQASLWGRDLYQHLDDVYSKKARFCVLFLSARYAAKAWTNHELKSAQARAFRENNEYILPLRLDDTEIPGIRPTLGYLDLRKTKVEDAAQLAIQKIKSAGSRGTETKPSVPSPSVTAASPTGRTGKLRVKNQFTEHDRDDFLETAYEGVAKYFEDSLAGLAGENPGFVGKFKKINANHFTAVIYRDGKNVAQCGIRLGGLGAGFTNQIIYSSDPGATNSMNEAVSVADDGEAMLLKSTGMSMMANPHLKDRLTPHDAAELFWALLTRSLQQ
jgi:hypothetical protein